MTHDGSGDAAIADDDAYHHQHTDNERSPLLDQHHNNSNSSQQRNGSITGTSTNNSYNHPQSRKRGIAVCISMFTLIFIIPCNVTLMTTIQSSVATELDASELVSWFTSSYLISVTAIMPLAGRLSQIFGARAYILGSICVQCTGLLLISASHSFVVFVLGRVICGCGAAAVTPVAFLLVTELTDPKNRGVFFGCINTAFTSGVACGAIFAGLLDPVLGWRSVFWIQVPVCLLAATAAFLSLPAPPAQAAAAQGRKGKGKNVVAGATAAAAAAAADDTDDNYVGVPSVAQRLAQLDYAGILTLISAVVLLLFSLSAKKISYTAIVLALLDFALFVFIESRWAVEPIIPISVLRHRGNLFTGLATIGLMASRWSVLFYTPIYAISVRDFSQAKAGLLLVPTDVGFAMGGVVIGWLHIRGDRSYYFPALLCYVLFAVTMYGLGVLSTTSSDLYTAYIPVSFANGFCAGAILNYTLAHVLFLTPKTTHVVVIPFMAMLRSLAGSFGSAISGGIFLRSLTDSLQRGFDDVEPMLGREWTEEKKQGMIRRLIGSPALVYRLLRGDDEVNGRDGRVLFEVALESYIDAFRAMFLVGAVVALGMAVVQSGVGRMGAREKKDEVDGGDGKGEDGADGNGVLNGHAYSDVGESEVGQGKALDEEGGR